MISIVNNNIFIRFRHLNKILQATEEIGNIVYKEQLKSMVIFSF